MNAFSGLTLQTWSEIRSHDGDHFKQSPVHQVSAILASASVLIKPVPPSNIVDLVMRCHLCRKGPFPSSGSLGLAFSSISYHGLIDNSFRCSSCQQHSSKCFVVYPCFLSLGPFSSNPQCFLIIKVYLFINHLYYSAFYKSMKAGALTVLMNTT